MEEQYGFVDPSKIQFLDEQSEQQPSLGDQAQQKPGLLKQSAQVGAGLLNAATRSITAPAELINALSTNEFAQKTREPGYKGVSEKIKSGIESVAGEGSTEAKNPLNKIAQYTASSLPAIAATGGLTIPKVLSDLAGSAAVVGTEAFTNNPLVKIGANILGQRGYSNLAKRIHAGSKAGSILNKVTAGQETHVETAKKALYEKKEALGSKIKTDTKPLINSLEEYKHKAKDVGSFTASEVKEAQRDVDKLLRKLDMPKKSADDIYNLKKTVNEFFDRPNLTKAQKSYYGGLNNEIKKHLETIGSDHPEFNSAWKTADELHSLQNWQSNLDKAVKEWLPSGKLQKAAKHPLSHGAIGILSGIAKGKSAGLLSALPAAYQLGSKGIAKPAAFVNYLYQNPEGQKILWRIVADAGKDASTALLKDFRSLDKVAEKFEQENPEIDQEQYGFVDPSKIQFID